MDTLGAEASGAFFCSDTSRFHFLSRYRSGPLVFALFSPDEMTGAFSRFLLVVWVNGADFVDINVRWLYGIAWYSVQKSPFGRLNRL